MSENTSYSVQLSKELRREIRKAAAEQDTSMAAWIRQAIEEKLKRQEIENPQCEICGKFPIVLWNGHYACSEKHSQELRKIHAPKPMQEPLQQP